MSTTSGYVIFVDESVLDGSVEMFGMTGGVFAALPSEAEAAATTAEALPPEELLARRHAVLSQIASGIDNPGTRFENFGAASEAATFGLPKIASIEPQSEPPADMRVLAGVGAILVDRDELDLEAIYSQPGVSVYPNVEVHMVHPDTETVIDAAAGAAAAANGQFWHLTKVGLASGQSGGRGIMIGILDTGIDDSHPEFAGKVVQFREFDKHGQVVGSTARDAGDHGTHVSSIAAGRNCGAAPDADLAVAAVLTTPNAQGRLFGYLQQIVAGMDWLVQHQFRPGRRGVDVVNASLGGSGYHNYLEQPVLNGLAAGISMIAAIGNDGRKGAGFHGSPGNYRTTLSVGASDSQDITAIFSDWELSGQDGRIQYPVPNLSAPGVDVIAAIPGNGYARMSGTSMATPLVAGIAARRMSANPALLGHPRALFLSLLSTLDPVKPHPYNLNYGGAGRIRA
ncbi:S8 family peptidase [Blastomonas sp. SL216]|uniref:S8 family peptidase n=1 Tax=Blastomonas sp. SL216 TaxID=2995169 RepID=UPI002377A14C|nr:S8 family serine peptidase [Blastomonas sp. SL216]